MQIGAPQWVEDDTNPVHNFLVGVAAAGSFVAAVTGGEDSDPPDPSYVKAWPKGLQLRIVEPLGWSSRTAARGS